MKAFFLALVSFRRRASGGWLGRWAALALAGWAGQAQATLDVYDAAITNDAASGVVPAARLTSAVTLTGSNRASFDFRAISGDATIEFIVGGDPTATGASGYLAVGANTSSNLRYDQYSNTGQMGFTQLGVADYLFSPAVSSPVTPTHIAYVWNAAARIMTLYWNGSVAGTSSGVSTSFAMPTGSGYLGANPGNTENMVGTIYRVTVYDDLLPGAVIQRHSDAYNDVIRPPVIVAFVAEPDAIVRPGSATLTWQVEKADALSIDGMDVTGEASLVVSPDVTTTYTLTATNAGGSVTAQVTVLVNPAPVIFRFSASRTFVVTGEIVTLSWNTRFGDSYVLVPEVGDVTGQTANGDGSIEVQPTGPVAYTLAVGNIFGTNTATVEIHIVHPAGHLVISEFMADNESTLADEDGTFSDWIEIYNPTTTAINLAGYYLTDEEGNPTKWGFPDLELAGGGYLVVFASGKDRTDPAAPLHTNFELNKDGEYLALVGPGPSLVHAFGPAYPVQRADIAYGIMGGDVNVELYLGLPTPGAANNEMLPPPPPVEFSRPGGFFTEAIQVTLTAARPAVGIRFTRDGSVPGPTNGTVYTGPIPISGTTRLRAVAIGEDGQVSRIAGVSYIKLAADLAGYASPLPILVIDNFGAGVILQKGWNSTGAGIKQVPRQAAIWATFDRVGGSSALSNAPQMFSLVGIRGRGAYSTQWRQKPYSVEAMDEHGEEVKVSPLGMPAHADWVLYFPDPDDNKDPTLFFNTFAYELSKTMGQHAVRFRWVEAFINEDGGELRLADRRGVYAIIEKVARGEERLNFQRLSADGTAGGWLLNINRMDPEPETGWPTANGATQPWYFHTAGPNRIQQTPPNATVQGDDIPQQYNAFINFDNPNGYVINPNQRAAIESWFKQFEDVLFNNAVWRDPVLGYRRYIDEREFAEYFILNVLTRNGDGMLLSLFPWKGDDGKLRIGPAWDFNWNPYYISGGPTGSLLHRSDQLWYTRLFADSDFYQLYIDRWWALRRGPLSNPAMAAIIDGQAADITLDKALLNGLPSTSEWTNRLGRMKSWLQARADWIDSNYLAPPLFVQEGGNVPDGFPVAIISTNGVLYFTTDGSDPRAPGGAVAGAAQAYQEPVAIRAPTRLLARIKNGTNWSGLATAVFYPPQDLTKLAVTEIMYNPPDLAPWSGSDLEFLELKNTGTNTLDLGTLTFTDGIQFTFTNGTRLGPGQFFLLARQAAAFQSKYPGVAISGIYTGKLDNAGEQIRLSSPFDSTVFSITYNNRAPWPIAADGFGFSAVPRDPVVPGNSDNGSHWRASAAAGGSPGADDPETTLPPVLINEILTHTDPPEVDAIELYNPTATDADIGGWFLSDDATVPKKFRIPNGRLVPAGGYLVFTEADFNPVGGTLFNFALDSAGDSVYLSSGDGWTNLTGYSHGLNVGAAANGVSFGRYLNSVQEEHFPAQIATTLWATNAGPRVGPVVIQEIMYHPEAGDAEFVELRNISGESVPLFDPAHPTNTWRVNGLGFTFPAGVVLPSNGLALVVGMEPAAFRAQYSVSTEVLVFGPFGGVLQDSGERLELQRPDLPDTNGVAYITVDEVRYNDKSPWPPGADGGGPSLQRIVATSYGDDPGNWQAALPTPGTHFVSGQPPLITVHPQSQIIVAYQDVTFRVTATGLGPIYYQWFFNGAPLAGATNDLVVLRNVLPTQAGGYQVVVYNTAGSAASQRADLMTLQPALILQQPQSVTTNSGRTVTFSVVAIGTGPLRYQWRLNGADLTGATSAILTLTNVQVADAGLYEVVIADDIGPMASLPAELNVLLPPVFVHGPQNQSVSVGGTAVFSVTTTGSLPIGYRWRRAFSTVTNVVLNSHTAFLVLANVQSTDGGNYTVVATNQANIAPGVLSPSGTLTVLADADKDGLPDAWETAHGLDPNDPADGALDPDGDGMTNWEEYIAGTDHLDPASYLKVELSNPTGPATVWFTAVSNKTYTVEYTDDLEGGAWMKLRDIAHQPVTRTEQVPDSSPGPQRYYRLVTPHQP
jgi:hypothetical protein